MAFPLADKQTPYFSKVPLITIFEQRFCITNGFRQKVWVLEIDQWKKGVLNFDIADAGRNVDIIQNVYDSANDINLLKREP